MHLRLNVGNFLPAFAIVDTAGENDYKRAREACAGLESGEIGVFDKANVDYMHLHDPDARGVQWVTRAKDNFKYRAARNLPGSRGGRNLKDQIIVLAGAKRRKKLKGWTLRRVEAIVEVDGKDKVTVFITNNKEWSARSVCELTASPPHGSFALRAARSSQSISAPASRVGSTGPDGRSKCSSNR